MHTIHQIMWAIFSQINQAELKVTPFSHYFLKATYMQHLLLKYQETVSDTDEENNNIPQPTMREIQTMLPAVLQYYQSKSDARDQIFKCVAKLESDAIETSLVPLSRGKVI